MYIVAGLTIMNDEFNAWIKNFEFNKYIDANYMYFKNILTNSVNLKKDEDVLIITDKGYENANVAPIVAGCFVKVLESLNQNYSVIMQDPKKVGKDTDPAVIDALKQLNPGSVIMIAVSNKLGSTNLQGGFRNFIKENGHRFTSSVGLGKLNNELVPKIMDIFNVNYSQVKQIGQYVKGELMKADMIKVQTDAGTDFEMKIKRKAIHVVDGEYTVKGKGGNLPIGEVYFPPLGKKSVNGTIVIDGSSRNQHGTTIIKDPIKLTIDKGLVTNIEGGEEAKLLNASLERAESAAKYSWGVRRLGEFGIGINPKASIVGSMIIDEKTLGTAHCAIGSNHWFGGTIYAPSHLDQVYKNPKFFLDGKAFDVRNYNK